MNKLYLYDPSNSIEERISEIAYDLIDLIDKLNPKQIKILDPYFDYEKMYKSMDKGFDKIEDDLWIYILHELIHTNSIESITVISADLLKTNIYLLESIVGDTIQQEKHSVEFYYRSKRFINYYYPNPNKDNCHPYIPHLHDRWLIWGNDNDQNALHIGTSFGHICNKDLTITYLQEGTISIASSRFDELKGFIYE